MTIVPTSEAEAAEAIRASKASRQTLAIAGGGTRAPFGRPTQTDETLSSGGLTGITRYEPTELVISARAGTPLAEIEAALDEKGQMLPFEPMDHRAIYGSTGAPTIGGIVATGASGPRRIQAGAARDLLLGVRLVNGRGEIVKSGGRVMKNVTGLDLVKLNCGAHGTLGFLTEVTFKALPKPERTLTLIFEGLDDKRAVEAMSAALGSPFAVSAAAHLPAGMGADQARTVLRLEHFAESITYRARELAKALSHFGRASEIEDDESRMLWRAIRDVEYLAQPNSDLLWRVSVAPTQSPLVLARLLRSGLSFRHLLDWGGGLIWIACAEGGNHTAVREAVGRDGHATLMRASDALRATLDVFQPQDAALMKLTAGIKASFDPDGVLNPGRMYAGL
ncbi:MULTISPECIES: glycolate oxidase subunit GlcE [unclassified Beijerinckia]|uniref:glycolate oxidase subunit GlcE n=1 Tax=unclassified Beijerinckia TaxID=2638183 RepID=UPI00089AB5A1|nr:MULTISPECIES: glycolate oxidase subunit GlcE [unclassified Beijerinckia]MDH7796578.1 glycolate oxidase FAD binding subunit [Beijerinckia sp. GAS462]SEC51086.1 glycolate oxidase FAD binding subunit [Beijerinckia sp. 28-YEA-48]